MTQQTMSEKEQFLNVWQMECAITLKILKAYPAAKADFKPHEKSRTAKDLAWTFVLEQHVIEDALKGQVDFSRAQNPAPATFDEVVRTYERKCQETADRVKAAPEGAFDKTVEFPVGPGKLAPVKVGQAAWMMLMDSIHHRGQLSVYLRMVGAKVPSIYGPTADEPWM